MTYGDKPFGLRDVKVTNIAGTVQADLPAAQTLTVRPRLTTGELIGDDALKAVVSMVQAAEWTLSAGGISLAALAIITGQATSVSGSTPTEKTTLNLGAGDSLPYFKIYGKSMGDGSDDVHVKFYKCKCTSLEGQFQNGQFWITQCSGVAMDDDSNGVIDIIQNETATALPAS
jgi:hypothetical protein